MMVFAEAPAPVRPSGPAEWHRRALRMAAGATAVGLLLGFLVAGVGSRVAMRVLFLTTGPHVRGVISDDGFAIGQLSLGGTANLLVLGTVVGVLGAFVYLAVRPFLIGPAWLRQATCALAAGAVIGSMLVHVEGVDFTLLGPVWLAIGMFVAIPALFALLAVPLVERAVHPDGWFANAPARLALLPLAAFAFPPLLIAVGLPAAAVALAHHHVQARPRLAAVARHPLNLWVVRAGWLAIALVGLVTLARDALILL